MAGEVVALGAVVDDALLGQRVCALVAGGGYAQYAVAPAGQCLPVPQALSMVEAAALHETLYTFWTLLFERACVGHGATVLLHVGTRVIDTMAIKLARTYGTQIIVTGGARTHIACTRALSHKINT